MKWLAPLVLVLLVCGCKKEHTVEERLISGGTWQITTLDYMKVTEAVTLDSSELESLNVGVQFGTITDAGSLTFNENGTGNFDYRLDNGFVRTGNFVWGLNEDGSISVAEVSINFLDFLWNLINNPDGDFTFNQQLFAFTMQHNGGDDFSMSGRGTMQIIRAGSSVEVGQYVYTIYAQLIDQ